MTVDDGRMSMKEAVENLSQLFQPAHDPVTTPAHYTGGEIECKDAMRAMVGHEGMMNFWQCCAFKYLWRYRKKNGVEDLEKARQCLDYLIEEATRG